jgi:hypothetical protein
MNKRLIKIINSGSQNSIDIYSFHNDLIYCDSLKDYKTPIGYEAEMVIGYDSILKKSVRYTQNYKDIETFNETEFLNNAINYRDKIYKNIYGIFDNRVPQFFAGIFVVAALVFGILIGLTCK